MIEDNNGLRYSKLFISIAILLILFSALVFAYLKLGPVPVAVGDKPIPFEKPIVRVAVRARIARQKQNPPFAMSENAFESGARIYQRQCSMCHGTPGHDAVLFKQMFPSPPQLWKKHGARGVGVSDEDPGFSYWVVSNGIRLSGMPSFSHTLSDTERWEVSLLLKNADKGISPQVAALLNSPTLNQPQ